MERYSVFLDWKNQYCQDDYITHGNLQCLCNTSKTTNGIFHRTRTENFTVYMETQKKPQNSQNNLEKEKWNWEIMLLDLRLYYKAIAIKTVWCWQKTEI